MKSFYNIDKLNFLTAGMPLSTGKGGYPRAFEIIEEMGLDGMEVEFVHGVRMSDETRQLVNKLQKEKNLVLTAHGPFYINLNSQEPDKIDASVQRIIDTANAAKDFGGYSITYHAAFYMGKDKETVFEQVKTQTRRILDTLEENNIKVWIRPETTGKATQWGDYEEIIKLSKEFEQVLPCIDFSHIHARTAGEYNTYDEFCKVLDRIGTELGDFALNNFHAHLAGIEYTKKGEKCHLNLEDSDMNYKDLLRAMKKFDVKGALVCESPNIETDAKLLKDYYLSL
ncbi:MAG: TIM barrel protein [Muribaculaceae bacterium]|nr:TIM barrel protein [Muribaculaceae bacterium]